MPSLRPFLYFVVIAMLLLQATANAAAIKSTPQDSLDKVSVQLVWKHQFEFAGFYAAIDKGFYREKGLDVELREYHSGIDITDEVLSGRATYGISNSQIVNDRLTGMPVRLLANYFKRPSLVIAAQAGITSLNDLKGKSLMIDQKDLKSPLVWKAFQEAGLTPGINLDVVPHKYNPLGFINGEVDATSTFITNEIYDYETSGMDFEVIDLSPHLPSMGDVYLFTSEKETDQNPDRTRDFIEASNRGWAYALQHPEEIINLILNDFSKRKTREALRYEAEVTRERILPVAFPIGAIYQERINNVASTIAQMYDSPEILSHIDGFLFEKSIPPSVPNNTKVEPNFLTYEEQAWLGSQKSIRVGIDPLWAPIEFFDENNHAQGMSISYLKRLEKLLDKKFEIEKDLTWTEVQEQINQGNLDVLPAVSNTPQRSKLYTFTRPHLTIPINIFSAADVAYLGGIQALENKRVAVVKDYAIEAWLQRDFPSLDLVAADSVEQALKWTASGEVFAFVGNLVTTSYYIGRTGLTQVRVAGETPYENQLSMAVSKDTPLLASILQKALDRIPKSERDEIYHQWISVQYSHSIDYRSIWQILIASSLLLLIILYWNRRLSKEVDQRRQVEAALIRAHKTAEQANQTKSRFVANMSHEIRTPLNAIIGMGQLIQKTPLTEQQKDYVGKLLSSSQSLLSVVNDVLDFSKIEAGKIVLNPTVFSPRVLLTKVHDLLSYQAREKGLVFNIKVDPDVPENLLGDVDKIQQILLNLASNAVKFTERGQVTLAASVTSTSEQHSCFCFSVEDTGAGIPLSSQKQLFLPFSQLDNSFTRNHSGTGLGLIISQELAQAMGGSVALAQSTSNGSIFAFEICLEHSAGIIATATPWSTTEQYSLPNANILLVEDDELNQQVAKELLETAGLTVAVVNNGQEAIDMLQQSSFDLVLMDLQMPMMDGYQASKLIREHFSSEELPIIAMTAHSATEEKERCLSIGMDGYISKPVEPALLTHTIRHFLPSHQQQSHKEISTESSIELQAIPEEIMSPELKSAAAKYLIDTRLKLLTALKDKDGDATAQLAHSLVGGLNIYGDEELKGLVEQIQKIADQPDNLPNFVEPISKKLDQIILDLSKPETTQA